MPLFEFECVACGAQGEYLVRSEDSPVCSACGSKKMKKLLSHFAPMSGTTTADTPCGGCDMSSQCGMPGGGCGGF